MRCVGKVNASSTSPGRVTRDSCQNRGNKNKVQQQLQELNRASSAASLSNRIPRSPIPLFDTRHQQPCTGSAYYITGVRDAGGTEFVLRHPGTARGRYKPAKNQPRVTIPTNVAPQDVSRSRMDIPRHSGLTCSNSRACTLRGFPGDDVSEHWPTSYRTHSNPVGAADRACEHRR
jgi:hypothetical protein